MNYFNIIIKNYRKFAIRFLRRPSGPLDVYLFRGTTQNYSGNPNAVQIPITYTSLDPLVATLFAVEGRNHGRAVVFASRRGTFSEIEAGEIDREFQKKERSVNLAIPPLEFAKNAEYTLDVDRALQILTDLGYIGLEQRLFGQAALNTALEKPDRRLNDEQILRFTQLMKGDIP